MIFKSILKKNRNLKNSQLNKSCYIFGNGASIKSFDLKFFDNLPAFSCGWLFLHNDYHKLNVLCDFEIHPGIFFPIWKNEYSKKIEFNYLNYIFKKKKRFEKTSYFFTSLSNYPGLIFYKNIFYLYHFGYKTFDKKYTNPESKFSLLENSLYSMIGVAYYMGFKKIYLVGMDYLFEKPINGHFYEKSHHEIPFNKKNEDKNKYFFDNYQNDMEFILIKSKNNSNSFLKTLSYTELFKTDELKNFNQDIIDINNLELLNKTNLKYKIF